jgi:recombinational DNA repair protein (RecF pathway)
MRTTITVSGVVLSSYPVRERGRFVHLLTDTLGLVGARVDGVLSSSSKLAPALATTTYGTYTLVRGAHEWRIRGAQSTGNMFYELSALRDQWSAFQDILRLLRTTLHGEEHTSFFYEELLASFRALHDPFVLPSHVRLLAEARILAHLGFADVESIPLHSYDADTMRALTSSWKSIETLVSRGKDAAHISF